MAYRYDPTRRSLLFPALGARFFEEGRPTQEPCLCAEMARLAYAPFEADRAAAAQVAATLGAIGFQEAHFVTGAGTQALLVHDRAGQLSVLAFRGTEQDGKDMKTNLTIRPTSWTTGGKVHQGFAGALRAVWPQLAPLLQAAAGRLVFTGHSLGGALATLAATLTPPAAVYTFGSPRVGDQTFVERLRLVPFHRYSNCCDVICRLPPEALSYRHVAERIQLSRDGGRLPAGNGAAIRADQRRARLAYLVRWSWRPGTVWTRDFADHAPINYVSAVGESVRRYLDVPHTVARPS